MALIGYARVSTAEQNLDLQRNALVKAGCDDICEEQASGAKAERPGLAEALGNVRRGDTLVVWKLDRLGRSMAHLIETVRKLEARGVGFRSLTEGVDTTTPGGTLVFHIFGALAQFERDLIRERTSAGLKAAEARGRKGGRRPVVTPDKLARARTHLAAGLTVREAAARVKVSKTALYKALNGSAETSGCATKKNLAPPPSPDGSGLAGPASAAPPISATAAHLSTHNQWPRTKARGRPSSTTVRKTG